MRDLRREQLFSPHPHHLGKGVPFFPMIDVSRTRKLFRIPEFPNDRKCPEITVGRPDQVTGKTTQDKKSEARSSASPLALGLLPQ